MGTMPVSEENSTSIVDGLGFVGLIQCANA